MKKYKEHSMVKGSDGFMELASLNKREEFVKAFAILNFDGQLATSTRSFDAIFFDNIWNHSVM